MKILCNTISDHFNEQKQRPKANSNHLRCLGNILVYTTTIFHIYERLYFHFIGASTKKNGYIVVWFHLTV